MSDTAPIALAGGTIQTQGASEFSGGTFIAPSGVGLGALTLNAPSELDFGGSKGLLAFGGFIDPNHFRLTIDHYFGQGGSSGTDRLIFPFGSQAAADSALPDIAFTYGNTTVSAMDIALGGGLWEIDPVTPVSEPGTWAAAALAFAGLLVTQRRRVQHSLKSRVGVEAAVSAAED